MDINLANVESVVHCLKKKTQRKTFDIIYIYIYRYGKPVGTIIYLGPDGSKEKTAELGGRYPLEEGRLSNSESVHTKYKQIVVSTTS